jgi:cysteine synthase A
MLDLIGKTPLVELVNIEKSLEFEGKILGKLESYNPTGSVKDRAAISMIEDAIQKGLLKEDTMIIEPTSGNTGIGLAAIGATKGYKVILTMPETMSIERRKILSAYGAELVLTEGAKGMAGAIEKAKELVSQNPNSFMPGQFDNPANPKVHLETTGPEIWEDTEGKIDIFVCGIGTGGTITGVGEFLKSKNPNIKIVAVEPEASPVLSGGEKGPHPIQGIGAGFVPSILNTKIYDQIVKVAGENAFKAARQLAKEEGILAGISSGAALWVAKELASKPENKEKNIVVVLPDTGERYYSTPIFMEKE